MNIIITNFTGVSDPMISYGLIGAPVGVVSSIATMGRDESLLDSSLSGGIGGIVGGVAGGLISREELYGPALGAAIGGSLARKMLKNRSTKDLLREAYIESRNLRDDSYNNSYGFSDIVGNREDKASDNQEKIQENKEEIASLKEEKSLLQEKNEDSKLSQDEIKEEIYGTKNDLENYLQNSPAPEKPSIERYQGQVASKAQMFDGEKRFQNKNKEEIKSINERISELNKRNQELINKDSNKTLAQTTTKDIIRDLKSDRSTGNNIKGFVR